MSGSLWSEIPTNPNDFFDGSHFIHATRRRLSVVQVPAGCQCHLTDSSGVNPQRCWKTLDPHLTHPTTTCEKGPAKNRMHNFVKAGLAACLRTAGAEVDVERCIPELSRIGPDDTIEDAVMDVVASFPNATRQY